MQALTSGSWFILVFRGGSGKNILEIRRFFKIPINWRHNYSHKNKWQNMIFEKIIPLYVVKIKFDLAPQKKGGKILSCFMAFSYHFKVLIEENNLFSLHRSLDKVGEIFLVIKHYCRPPRTWVIVNVEMSDLISLSVP